MEYLDDLNKIDNSLKINHIYSVDNCLVILTTKENYLYDGINLYSLKKYKNVDKVIVFNKEIYVVVSEDGVANLIYLKDLEVVLQSQSSIGMNLLNGRYISVHSYGEKVKLFDLQYKKFIKGPSDLKFDFILAEDLFVFENDEYDSDKHKRYLVNSDGDIVYKCENSFPYFVNGNLFLINRKDEEINIIHDFLGKREKSTIIKKQGIVLGKPQYYNGDIVIVVEDGILIMDADMNIKKKVPYDVKYPISDTTIERDSFLMRIKIKDSYRTLCVGLSSDYVIEHDSIELLPYWLDRKRTLKCYDKLDEGINLYYLYDESGNFLYQKKSKDAHIVENEDYNLFIFYGIDGTNKNCIYNIDSGEERIIPWHNVEFGLNNNSVYQNYALCYNEETDKYDIIDDNLTVCFSGIDLKMLKRGISNISYVVNNNYVSILEPVANGPQTFFHKIVVDKDNNIIYNGYDAVITHIGKYIEIKEGNELRYLNTITGEFSTNITENEKSLLPDALCIEDDTIKLKKSP